MQLLAANDLVRNALRRSAYPARSTPNGAPHRFWSLSGNEKGNIYRGPFQTVFRRTVSNQTYIQLRDGMRNNDVTSPGLILLASGQLWGKAPQYSAALPDTSSKHFTILYGMVDFQKEPGENGWAGFFFSDEDNVTQHAQDRFCRFPVAAFQNDSSGIRLIQQFQYGDFRVVSHLGKWYEDEDEV